MHPCRYIRYIGGGDDNLLDREPGSSAGLYARDQRASVLVLSSIARLATRTPGGFHADSGTTGVLSRSRLVGGCLLLAPPVLYDIWVAKLQCVDSLNPLVEKDCV